MRALKKDAMMILVSLFVLLTVSNETVHPFEYRFGIELFEGLFYEQNLFSESSRAFDQDDQYNILGVYPGLHLDFENNVGASVLCEIEWIHSWEAASDDRLTENETNARVANAFVGYTSPLWSADVGKMPFRVGDGKILSADAPGFSFEYGGRGRTFVKGDFLLAFDECPMAQLTWGFRPAFYETFEVTAAWFKDTENRMAELFRPWYLDTGVKSAGDLYWIGGDADFFAGDVYMSVLAFYQWGAVAVDFPNAGAGVRMDVSAYMCDIEAVYNISDALSTGCFLFLASGDRNPLRGDVKAFLSPMPFNDRSAIFFSGGFERYDRSESFRLGGVSWAGVATPGLTFSFYDPSGFNAKLSGAMIFPDGELMDDDDWIGWETDVSLSFEYRRDCRFFAEGGMFRHGNYIQNISGIRPDPAFRFSGGVALSF